MQRADPDSAAFRRANSPPPSHPSPGQPRPAQASGPAQPRLGQPRPGQRPRTCILIDIQGLSRSEARTASPQSSLPGWQAKRGNARPLGGMTHRSGPAGPAQEVFDILSDTMWASGRGNARTITCGDLAKAVWRSASHLPAALHACALIVTNDSSQTTPQSLRMLRGAG